MDKILVQAVVDDFIPKIRKELIGDVQAAMSQIEAVSKLTMKDLACVLESVADAALKASAELLVETLSKID